MIKSYSGVFRLGEATSTWDADSPVRDFISLVNYGFLLLTDMHLCIISDVFFW